MSSSWSFSRAAATGSGIAEHAEIAPRLRNLPLGQIEMPDGAGGVGDAVLEFAMGGGGQILVRPGRDRRHAQLEALLHEQGIKEAGVILARFQLGAELVDGGGGAGGFDGLFQLIEKGRCPSAGSFWKRKGLYSVYRGGG